MKNCKSITEKRLSLGFRVPSVSTWIPTSLLLGLSLCLVAGSAWAKPLALDSEQDEQASAASVTPSAPAAQREQSSGGPTVRGKKPHPVVVAPEPLLPTALPAASASATAQTSRIDLEPAAATPIEPDPFKFNNKKAADADFQEKPEKAVAITPAMATSDDEMTMRPPAQEPGMYPVGFTPAVRARTTVQVKSLDTAINHYNRGVYYSQRKQWDQAVSEYNQAVTLNMMLADAYVGLSTAALHKRDWENALRNGHQALRLKDNFLEPTNITQARYNLSTVYCVADDYIRATQYYEQVKLSGHPETDDLFAFLQTNCHP